MVWRTSDIAVLEVGSAEPSGEVTSSADVTDEVEQLSWDVKTDCTFGKWNKIIAHKPG